MNHLPDQIGKVEQVNLGKAVKLYGGPVEGPNKGAVNYDAAILAVQGTITVATALWDGRDVSRVISRLQLQQQSGAIMRWNLAGDEGRAAAIKYGGIRKWHEHANVAIGAGQAISLYYRVPFRKEFTKRPRDFSLPAYEFQWANVSWNTLGNAASGTTVLSADSLKAYLLFEWHESKNAEVKCVDAVGSQAITTATQGYLQASGAIHDLDLFKTLQGTNVGGGDPLTSVTNLAIPEMGIEVQTPADLTDNYRRKRMLQPVAFAATPSNEQVLEPALETTQKMIPVITATEATSVWDGPVIDKYRINITGGTTSVVAITREILYRPEAAIVACLTQWKLPANSTPKMKTAGKTRRDLTDAAGRPKWTDYQMMVGPLTYGRIPAAA